MTNQPIRVLIVDDDSRLSASLGRDFEDAGVTVFTAVSAAEANAILKQQRFDAILSDNQMIGANGSRLLADVRKNYPETKRFMLSGDITASQRTLIENEIGVIQIFEKPCRSEVLITSIVDAVVNAK